MGQKFLSDIDIVGNVSTTTLASDSCDISTWQLAREKISIASQETNPEAIFFKPDGTKMYIMGRSGDDVNEYALSTAWDVTTASLTDTLDGLETSPTSESNSYGIYISPDGIYFYLVGHSQDQIIQYTMSTAWDISTASYTREQDLTISGGGDYTDPTGLNFKSDGTMFWVTSHSKDTIQQYTLSSAWDISTISVGHSFPLTNSFTINRLEATLDTYDLGSIDDVWVSEDGTKVWLFDSSYDTIHQFDLSTAFNVTTATYAGATGPRTSAYQWDAGGLYVNETTGKAFTVAPGGDYVRTYNIGGVTFTSDNDGSTGFKGGLNVRGDATISRNLTANGLSFFSNTAYFYSTLNTYGTTSLTHGNGGTVNILDGTTYSGVGTLDVLTNVFWPRSSSDLNPYTNGQIHNINLGRPTRGGIINLNIGRRQTGNTVSDTLHDHSGVMNIVSKAQTFTHDGYLTIGQKLQVTGNADLQVFDLGGTVIFSDTFTETNTTDLASHTPDTGAGWTKVLDTGTAQAWNVIGGTGVAQVSVTDSSDGMIYLCDTLPTAVDYEIKVDFLRRDSSDDTFHIIFKYKDADNFFFLQWSASYSSYCKLRKKEGGSFSDITHFDYGAFNQTADNLATALKVRFIDNKIMVWDIDTNGYQAYRGSYTVTDFTNDGNGGTFHKFGMGIGAIDGGGHDQTNTWKIDKFEVKQLSSAATLKASTKHYIENGLVGIGTTNPSAKLHLATSASGGLPSFIIQDNARSGSAALNYIALTDSADATHAKIGYLSGLNTEFTLQNLVGNTSLVSSAQVNITSGSGVSVTGGNITLGGDNRHIFFGGNNTFVGELSNSNKLALRGGGSNTAATVYIDSSGKMGLGTSSPAKKLHVSQTTDSEGVRITGYDDENNSHLDLYVDNFGNDCIVSSEFLKIESGGSQRIRSAGYLRLESAGTNNQLEVNTNYMKFTSGGSEQMRLTTTGLGIGTDSPAKLLHIDNPSGASAMLLEGASGYSSEILFRTDPASGQGWLNYDYSGNTMTFGTNASEKMRLTTDGKLGIGTNSPSSTLHVNNTAGFSIDSERGIQDGSRNGWAHYYGAGNAHILGRSLILESTLRLTPSTPTASTTSWRFQNVSNVLKLAKEVGGSTTTDNVFTVNNNKIGIGTASPSSYLDVVGDADVGVIQVSHTSNGCYGSILFGTISKLTGDCGTWSFKNTNSNVTQLTLTDTKLAVPGEIEGGSLDINGVADISGVLTTHSTVNIGATQKLYLDGGSNTYITESSDDVISFYRGGSHIAYMDSAGIFSMGNVYTGNSGQFRNYGGTWKATTGVSGNGFEFTSADATALTISSTGSATFAGAVTAKDTTISTGTTVALANQPSLPLNVSNGGTSVDGRVFINVKHDQINTASAVGAGLQMQAGAVTTGTASYVSSQIFLQSAGPGNHTIHSAPKGFKFYVDNHDTAAGSGTSYAALGDLALSINEDRSIDVATNLNVDGILEGDQLDINGNADISGTLTVNGIEMGAVAERIRNVGDTDSYIDFGGADTINFATNNTNRLVITNSTATFAGDLKLFKTAPTLLIEGDGVTSANLKFKTNTVDRWNINVPSGQTNLAFTTGSTNVLSLDTSNNATFAGDVSLVDNKKLIFGTGSDVEIKFDGSDLVTTVPTGSSFLIGTNGGTPHDNNGTADFAVDVNANPRISLYNNQVQFGGSDMNWSAYFGYDGGTKLGAWDNDIHIFTQGGGSATAKNIYIRPQNAGGTTTTVATFNGDNGTTLTGAWSLGDVNGGSFKSYTYGTELDISALNSGGWARAHRIITSDTSGQVFFGVLGNNTTTTRAYWTLGDPDNMGGVTGYNSSNGIVLLKNGRVGVGVTNPTQRLHVDGHALISAEKYYYVAGGGAGMGSDASGNLILRQNSTNLMTTSGSNVSFAGEVEATSLDINGAADISGALTASGTVELANSASALTLNNSTHSELRYGTSCFFRANGSQNILDSPLNVIKVSGTERARVNSSGLSVTGTITSTGQITGTELEGTSLDINGNADISGTLNVTSTSTFNDPVTITGPASASGGGILDIRDDSGNTSLRFGGNSTYSWIQTHSSKPLRINEAGNNVTFGTGTVDFEGNVSIAGNLTTEGDLIINNTSNVSIKDTIITLNSGATTTDNRDIGLMFERVGNNKFFGWDEDESYFTLAENTQDVSVATTTQLTMGTLQTLRAKISAETLKVGSGNIITVDAVKDEDTMSSDSATALATQQSIKAYADTKLPKAGGTLTDTLFINHGSSDSNLVFQLNGSNKWLIGRDNSPDSFRIYNYGTSSAALNIATSDNAATFAGTINSGAITSTGQIAGTTLYGNQANGNGSSLKLGRADNSNYWHVNHAGNDFRLYNEAGSGSHILFGVDPGGNVEANNVGIGTPTPSAKLDVFRGSTNGLVAHFSGNNADRGLNISTYQNSNHDAGVILDAVDPSHGTLKFQTSSSDVLTLDVSQNATFAGNITLGDSHTIGDDADDNLEIKSSSGENIIIDGAGRVILRDGGSTKLETKSDGVDITGELQADSLDIDGNADISGTTTLGNKLTITTTTDNKIDLIVPSSGDNSDWNYIQFKGSDGARDAYFGTQNDGTPAWYRDDGAVHIKLNSNKIYASHMLQVNGELEATSLDINGNADISGTLDVAGDTTITNGLHVHHNEGIEIGDTGNNSTARTTLTSFASGGNSRMKIKGGNFIHDVTFETSWNNFEYAELVSSYNTSDTTWKLHKSASDGSTAATTTISTGFSSFAGDLGVQPAKKIYLDGGTNTYISEVSSDEIAVYTGALKRLTIDYNGLVTPHKVAIGTTSASNKLHIFSDDTSENALIKLEQDGTGDAVIDYLLTGTNLWRVGIDHSDGDKFKWSTGTFGSYEKMSLDTSGNLAVVGDVTVGDDLFFASGAEINFDNNDVRIYHSSDTLTFVDGALRFQNYNNTALTNIAHQNFSFESFINNSSVTNGSGVSSYVKLGAAATNATGSFSTYRGRAYGENRTSNTSELTVFHAEYRNWSSDQDVLLSNHYGFKCDALGVGGTGNTSVVNNFGIYLNPGATATNNYGVYQVGSSVTNYFQGKVGINTAPAAGVELHVNGEIRVDDTNGVATRMVRSNYFSASSDIEVRSGASGDIILGDGTARLTIASDDTATFAGNINVTANSATVKVQESGGADMRLAGGGSIGYVGTWSNDAVYIMQNGASAITIDTSRNATFAGNIDFSNNKGLTWAGSHSVRVESNILKLNASGGIQAQNNATFQGSITGKDSGIIIDSIGGPYGRIHGTSSIFLGGGSTTNVQLSAALIPDGDSSRSLGSSSRYWSHGYIDAVTTTGNVTAGGDLTVTGNTTINRKLTKTNNTDGNNDGDVVYFGSTTGMEIGEIYYLTSSGTWALADADAESTAKGMLGVALGGSSDSNGVLIRGMVTLDHDPGTVGDTLFLHTTAGQASSTAPSGNGDIVRVVGYCLDSSNGQIYFNPDGTFVEVTA